ncbi:MAG: ABC transporter substrate-binding protein [Candidatus Aenigmatarchaeota archaeon]
MILILSSISISIFYLFRFYETKEQEEIVIGYNADQSGTPISHFGILGRYGFEIAVDEINSKGGILGKKIRAVILDDKGDKNISKQNMERLIFQEKAIAVVGPANSDAALYWLDLAQENEVIVISHIATATEITTKYKDRPRNFIFGIRTLDKDQIRLSIAWGIKRSNNGEFAIIYESTSYGIQGAKDTTEVLSRWGKVPVFVKSFDRNISIENLTKIIESAKEAKADVIMLYTYPDSNAKILKAMENVIDYNPILIGTAANSLGLWQLAGSLSSKLVFPAPVGSDFNENTKILTQKIKDRYNVTAMLLSSAASAYDAVYLIKASIEKARTFDKVAVRDAMENIEIFNGTMRTFVRPFSKQDHELLSVTDSFLSHWVDGKVVQIYEDISSLEIR